MVLWQAFSSARPFATCKKKYQLINLPGDVYFITELPVNLRSLDVVLVAVATLAICFLATIYPAHLAAQLETVEALRHG